MGGSEEEEEHPGFWGGAGCEFYNQHGRLWVPHLLGTGASRLHFPCGHRAELTGLSGVTRDEPSGSASGEEGGLGISIGVEEEE